MDKSYFTNLVMQMKPIHWYFVAVLVIALFFRFFVKSGQTRTRISISGIGFYKNYVVPDPKQCAAFEARGHLSQKKCPPLELSKRGPVTDCFQIMGTMNYFYEICKIRHNRTTNQSFGIIAMSSKINRSWIVSRNSESIQQLSGTHSKQIHPLIAGLIKKFVIDKIPGSYIDTTHLGGIAQNYVLFAERPDPVYYDEKFFQNIELALSDIPVTRIQADINGFLIFHVDEIWKNYQEEVELAEKISNTANRLISVLS